MAPSFPQRRGLYFEEFELGQTIHTPGRTITESDIVTFAGVSGDFNLIHTDSVYAATTPFGQRVARSIGRQLRLGAGLPDDLPDRRGTGRHRRLPS